MKLKIKIDPTKQYFPLLVLLRRNKTTKALEIDAGVNKNIQRHIDLFKKIYNYHNKPARHVYDKLF